MWKPNPIGVAKGPQLLCVQPEAERNKGATAVVAPCNLVVSFADPVSDQARAFTRLARREIFREAVLLWTTPLVTPRISSG